ncbi:hypothetical protein K8R33_00065 [archaeon]|nr:hypothetical protein [archaeon]
MVDDKYNVDPKMHRSFWKALGFIGAGIATIGLACNGPGCSSKVEANNKPNLVQIVSGEQVQKENLPVFSQDDYDIATQLVDNLYSFTETQDISHALDVYEDLMSYLPDSIEYEYFDADLAVGIMYTELGDADSALSYLKKAVEGGKKYTDVEGLDDPNVREIYGAALNIYSGCLIECGYINEAKELREKYLEIRDDK